MPGLVSLSHLFFFKASASLWLLLGLSLPAAAPPAALKSADVVFIMQVTLRDKLVDLIVLTSGGRRKSDI